MGADSLFLRRTAVTVVALIWLAAKRRAADEPAMANYETHRHTSAASIAPMTGATTGIQA